jgi:hypothetical protein
MHLVVICTKFLVQKKTPCIANIIALSSAYLVANHFELTRKSFAVVLRKNISMGI